MSPTPPDHCRVRLAAGVATFARVLGRTLGPTPRRVLCAVGTTTPELIGDGGTLARRITALADPDLNTGAMILRTAVETVTHAYGDGVGTTAVLAEAMVAHATRVIEGGAEPVAVRRGLDRGVEIACRELAEHAIPLDGYDDLARLATGATQDAELGAVLAELYDFLGGRAWLLTEEQPTPGYDREYVDGARWRARPGDRELLARGLSDVTVSDPLVVVVDDGVERAEDLVPAVELAGEARRPLVVVARDFAEPARLFLRRNRNAPGAHVIVVPVCPAGPTKRRTDDLADIALLCGATVRAGVLGRPARSVRLPDCGAARRVVVRHGDLTITGGVGGSAAIDERIAELEGRLALSRRGDAEWRALRARIARLAGALGVVRFGVGSPTEKDAKKAQIAKAQRVLELAIADGVVPGGGAAYLDCVPAVMRAAERTTEQDERVGLHIVAAALAEPIRRIVANHEEIDPSVAVERARELGSGWGFDASTGTYALMAKAGVVDAAGVLIGALRAAGSCTASIVSVAAVVGGTSS